MNSERHGNVIDFEPIVTFLDEENRLKNLETVVDRYITGNQSLDYLKYFNFQDELTALLGKYQPLVLRFLRGQVKVRYAGRNNAVYKRLLNLQHVSQFHFNSINNAITIPHDLRGHMISFNNVRPQDLLLTFLNNNGENFQTSINYNGLLTLTNGFIQNLSLKFSNGINQIDPKLIDDFISETSELISKLQKFLQNNEKNQQK